jgi:hypothetical protein
MFFNKKACNLCACNMSITLKTNSENNKKREQKQLVRKQKIIETMKTRISHLVFAAIFTLLLAGGNVKAEGTELIASGHENAKETSLEVENWMVNDDLWSTSYDVNLNVASEIYLEVENWMVNDKLWPSVEIFNNALDLEIKLEVENWMIDEKEWEIPAACISQVLNHEKDLNLEGWMINQNIWNRL